MFGGFSAIETDPDGTGFVVVTDKGYFVTARILRDQDGHIAQINADPLQRLLSKDGLPFGPYASDAEGLATQLALLVDGSIAQDLVRNDPGMARAAKQAATVLLANAGVKVG